MEQDNQYNLLSAYEASTLTEKICEKRLLDELSYINQQIRKQIQEGKYICELFNKKISLETKKVLEDLYYEIEYIQDGINEYKIVIKWKN